MSRPKSYGDALFADCPTRTVFDTISGRWVPLILVALAKEPSGYRELLRRIEGITPKVLTESLRRLENDGIVSATRSVEGRVRNSQYELTPRGQTLLPIVQAVKVWAEEHLPEVEAARQAHLGEGT